MSGKLISHIHVLSVSVPILDETIRDLLDTSAGLNTTRTRRASNSDTVPGTLTPSKRRDRNVSGDAAEWVAPEVEVFDDVRDWARQMIAIRETIATREMRSARSSTRQPTLQRAVKLAMPPLPPSVLLGPSVSLRDDPNRRSTGGKRPKPILWDL